MKPTKALHCVLFVRLSSFSLLSVIAVDGLVKRLYLFIYLFIYLFNPICIATSNVTSSKIDGGRVVCS
jgi:hypothetical protein